MVNGSQFAVSKPFYYLLHDYNSLKRWICDYENVARKIKPVGNTSKEHDIVNIKHIKLLPSMRDRRNFE